MKFYNKTKSKLQKKFPKASFVRNVSILAGGTVIAQVLGVIALPFITRLYTPEDFSVLAIYSALLTMIGGIACLRFEIAISIPEDESEAANLLVLGLLFTTIISVAIALLLWLLPFHIINYLGMTALASYLWLVPVGIWLVGAFACAQYWAKRKKKFVEISKTRLTQICACVVVQILLGMFTKIGPLGLLLGQATLSLTGLYGLGKRAWADIQPIQQSITYLNLKRTFVKYINFPKYSTVEAFSNNASIELPILIIAAVAVGPEAGYALLAMKAAAVPMGLIGSSISQVYLSHASDEYRTGCLPSFTSKIIAGLMVAGVGPLLMVGILAPYVMPWIFGENWVRAGNLVSWMTPWFILQFIASPISMAMHVTGNQRIAMLNQIWGLVLRVGFTSIAAIYYEEYIVEIYSVTGLIFYLGYLLIILKVSDVKVGKLLSTLFKPIIIVFFWIMLALVVKATIASVYQ